VRKLMEFAIVDIDDWHRRKIHTFASFASDAIIHSGHF